MRVARILGIEITVHYSWLFVFALVVWSLTSDVGPLHHLPLSPSQRVVLGTLSALLFFASVLVHELAHARAARAQGVSVRGVTLFLFGGVSDIEGEPADPRRSAWIALAGPLASFVLAGAFYAIAQLGGVSASLRTASAYLASANFALGLFNLLPAYPLDGGRLLRALIWQVTKDRERATVASADVGTMLAASLVVYGIYDTFADGFGGGLWVTLIGWFVLSAATAEGIQARLAQALRGRLVCEFATAAPARIRADATVADAMETMMRTGRRALPVQLGGQCVGLLSVRDLAKVGADELDSTYVTAVMTRAAELVSVAPMSSALGAFELMNQRGIDELPIVGSRGTVLALVTRDSLVCRPTVSRRLTTAPRPTPDHLRRQSP
jgi:Zn-dependent protease/CBS domain-containing protein